MSESSVQEYRRRFEEAVNQPDEDVDLAKAALYISGIEYSDLDIENCLMVLDSLAEGAKGHIGEEQDIRRRLEGLSGFLFEQQRFHGNDDDYYDPRNSYLNEVLDRRIGIPITLSLVYMEVARRLGVIFEGIGLPGHFVIRTGPPEDELYVDPYNGGRIMTRHDCERTVRELFQGRIELQDEHLRPYAKKEFLVRVLTNLKHTYVRLEDYPRALNAADLVAAIDPSMGSNLKERAAVYLAMKQYRMAIGDLETYLRSHPDAEDAEQVRAQIKSVWTTLSTMN